MNYVEWLARLAHYEQTIQFSTLAPAGVSPMVHLHGDIPILVSAPHSTIHMRNGRFKRADGFTGAFAQLIHDLTGAHALYASHRLPADPNWDKHSPYKSFLARIVEQHNIQFVLDLHGMSNWHKIGLALGTINGRSCPQETPIIEQTLTQYGFKQISEKNAKTLPKLDWQTFVTNHSRFTGGVSSHTITRFVTEELQISGAQLELCSTIRVVFDALPSEAQKMFRGNAKATQKMIRAISDLMTRLI